MITHDEIVSAKLVARDLDAASAFELYPPGYGRLNAIFLNGDFESWASATNADNWIEVISGGSVNRDDTDQRSGTYCCRIDKTSGAVVSVHQDIKNTAWHPVATQGMSPSKWYHVYGWSKASKGGTFQLRIRNVTPAPDVDLQADGTWTDSIHYFTLSTTTTWRRFSFWFQVDPTFGTTDTIRLMIRSDPADSTGSFYADDWNVEGPFDRPGLYYSTKTMTFQGDTYTPQVLNSGPSKDSLKIVQPRSSLELANANRPLRPYMDPDTFSGGRLYHRLLFLDPSSSFAVDQDTSLIYWQGVMRRPKRGTDAKLSLPVVGRLNPTGVPFPGRLIVARCQIRQFGDSVDCFYTHTTTAVNDNPAPNTPSDNITVSSGTNLVNGQKIKIGNSPEVTIVSGGGTGAITVSVEINWKTGDAVRYTRCDRVFSSCEKRAQDKFYLGFRSTDVLPNAVWNPFNPMLDPNWIPFSGPPVPVTFSQTRQALEITDERVVPVVIGRVWIRGQLIEQASNLLAGGGPPANVINAQIWVIAEGESNLIVRVRDDQEGLPNIYDNGGLIHGIYWRPGALGIAGTEDVSAYNADPIPPERPQNRDFVTASQVTYSRSMYVIVYSQVDAESKPERLIFDVKGAELQKYLATGVVDGSPVWTPNPIWGAVWYAITKRFGFDLLAADMDSAVHKPDADYCDAVLTSTLAITETTAAGTAFIIPVKHTRGFYVGQTIDVGGDTGLEVNDVFTATNEIKLTASITFASGETVQGYVSRWEAHLQLASAGDGLKAFKDLLGSCLGYITQDHATGRQQFRVERNNAIDQLTNGNLDAWTGSVPDGWIVNIGGASGTVTEETNVIHTEGGSAAKLTRNNGDGQIRIHQNGITTLKGGNWYLASGWIRATTPSGFGFNQAFRMRHRNLSDAHTWWDEQDGTPPEWDAATNKYAMEIPAPADTWLKIYSAFYWPDRFDGHTYQLELHTHTSGHAAIGEDQILYLDDWKVDGPLAGYYRDTDDNWLAAETVINGSLDAWSAGVPVSGWSKDETGGTIAEETTIVQGGGGSSASFLKSGTGVHYLQYDYFEALPSREYEVEFWHYWPNQASTNFAASIRLSIFSWQTNNWLTIAGTWSGSQQVCYNPGVIERFAGQWTYHSFRFTVEAAHEVWQSLQLRLHGHAENSSGVQEYYDNVSIRGPVDRVPILQPGMGILTRSFKHLEPSDSIREVNQLRVSFKKPSNEEDRSVANDYERQDRQKFVKKMDLSIPSIAHRDHASRQAKIRLNKISGGIGGRFDVGWHALLAQPGDMIAIRHEQPEWTGEMKRITNKTVNGAGKRKHLLCGIDVEDYDETHYTDVAEEPGDDDGMLGPLGTLTLVVDSVTVGDKNVAGSQKSINLTWTHSPTLPATSFLVSKWYVSQTEGFTPGPNNRFATLDVATHMGAPSHPLGSSFASLSYSPTTGDVGEDVYFVVKLFFIDGLELTSNEVAVFVTGITNPESDPTSVENVEGNNYLSHTEGQSAPDFWTVENSSPTFSKSKPDSFAVPGIAAHGLQNPLEAVDGAVGDDGGGSAAECMMDPGVAEIIAHDYKFTVGASAILGQWYIDAQRQIHIDDGAIVTNMRYGTNGVTVPFIGANYSTSDLTRHTELSALHSASAKTNLIVRLIGTKTAGGAGADDDQWDIFNLEFWEITGGTYAFVGSDEIVLRWSGSGAKPLVWQQIHGVPGIITGNTELVFSVYAKSIETTDGLLTCRVVAEGGAGVPHTVLTLGNTGEGIIIPGTWQRYAARWKPASDQLGPFVFEFECASTKVIQTRKSMLTLGSGVFAYGHHYADQTANLPFGVVGNFTPGPWVGDYTTQVRIATVTL